MGRYFVSMLCRRINRWSKRILEWKPRLGKRCVGATVRRKVASRKWIRRAINWAEWRAL